MQEVPRSGADLGPCFISHARHLFLKEAAAGNGECFISQCLYEKHSIACPAVHTVAKRTRLIVSGLMKLSSSFLFRAHNSAFSLCPRQAFSGLLNLPEIAAFTKTWSSEKTKKSQPPPSLSPLPDSAGQKYHLSFSCRLLSCNSCLLFNVALQQVQQRAQQRPEHTRCGTRASSSHATWPTLSTRFLLAERRCLGVWGGVNCDCLAMLAPGPKSSAVLWWKLYAAIRQLALLMGKSY